MACPQLAAFQYQGSDPSVYMISAEVTDGELTGYVRCAARQEDNEK